MTASRRVAVPAARLGRFLMRRSQTRFSLLDQGLVSGLGFLTGIVGARLVGIEEFGRFAVIMILALLAQGFLNALIIAPLMSLAGTPRGRSAGFFASALAATVLVSVPLAFGVMALLTGLEIAESKPVWTSLIASAGALAFGQNLLLTVRRVLFALGRGGEGLAMDAARGVGLVLAFLVVWGCRVPFHVDTLAWLLAAVAAGPALAAMWPVWRAARGRVQVMAVLKRCWPMARWLLPTVVTTFGQEQIVWLIVGYKLGDASVGGLRAAQYLVSLAYPFMSALENVVPGEATRAFRDGGFEKLRAYVVRTTLAFSPIAVGFPVVAAALAPLWLRLFFGRSFEGYAGCLQIFALVVLIVFARDMMAYFFRALQHTKVTFQAFVVSSSTTLLAILPLLHAFGVLGAAAGIALGQGVSMLYLLGAAIRACQAPAPPRSYAASADPRPI